MPKETTDSVRINKYLADHNYSTRRGADLLIKGGKVRINGRRAVLGDKVLPGDKVEVKDERAKKWQYFAFHKPAGFSTDKQLEGKDIGSVLSRKDIFPVGRLDKLSRGLLILTNDGRITEPLLSPSIAHDKEYEVKVDKKVTPFLLRHMEQGVKIEGYKTKPATAKKLTDNIFSLTLGEGKKHQIRRMCVALGFQVTDLVRTRIVNVVLDDLQPGALREIKGEELTEFLTKLGLA